MGQVCCLSETQVYRHSPKAAHFNGFSALHRVYAIPEKRGPVWDEQMMLTANSLLVWLTSPWDSERMGLL